MADQNTPLLQLTLQETGGNENNWGDILNQTLTKIEAAIEGTGTITVSGGTRILTDDEARPALLQIFGNLADNCDVMVPPRVGIYRVFNGTTNAVFRVRLRANGFTNPGHVLPRNRIITLFCTGSDVIPFEETGTIPVGGYMHSAITEAPDDYLKCDGAAYSRATYAKLFAKIGTLYGAGDGSTTFNVPNLKGKYLRGSGAGSGTSQDTTDYGVGAVVGQTIQTHAHGITINNGGLHNHPASAAGAGAHDHGYFINVAPAGGAMTSIQPSSTGGSARSVTDVGNHSHVITVGNDGLHAHTATVADAGSAETRPNSVVAHIYVRYQ